MSAGFYVHIPFCEKKCPYCDFYSLSASESFMDDYAASAANCGESMAESFDCKGDTLYFGGGTPSLLGAKRLGLIIDALAPYMEQGSEITVECNPKSSSGELFAALAAIGVNRISMGMQSAVENERLALGRRSSPHEILKLIKQSRSEGIGNISLDLMLGVPHMTMESLEKSLNFIAQADVPHLSAYMLKIEEGTQFYRERKVLDLADEDGLCDMYLRTVDFCKSIGLYQYEISNFSRTGFESKHNLKYWRCEEYLGIGPSAHSYMGGKRFYFPRDVENFVSVFKSNGDFGSERLKAACIDDGDGGSREEKLMLGLRLCEGVPLDIFTSKALEKVKRFESNGLMAVKDGFASLTSKGFLLSNTIISEVM